MQKLMLSPRHLFEGKQQVYWSSHAGFDATDGPTNGNRASNDNSQTSTLSRLISSRTETPNMDKESHRKSLPVDYYVFCSSTPSVIPLSAQTYFPPSRVPLLVCSPISEATTQLDCGVQTS